MKSECRTCHEVKDSTEYYGLERSCKECKKAKVYERRKQIEMDLAVIETKLDEMSFARDKTDERLDEISEENKAILDITTQQRNDIDDVVERLEHLTNVISRLTKSVMTIVNKGVKEE